MRSWKEIMNDPRIDDSGDYDYYAEELPEDGNEWIRYTCKCDTCGKEHYLNKRYSKAFYCYDGWDTMDYTECWKCTLDNEVCRVKKVVKKHTIDKIKMEVKIAKVLKGMKNPDAKTRQFVREAMLKNS